MLVIANCLRLAQLRGPEMQVQVQPQKLGGTVLVCNESVGLRYHTSKNILFFPFIMEYQSHDTAVNLAKRMRKFQGELSELQEGQCWVVKTGTTDVSHVSFITT